ncbi:hypothetical protein [Aeromicrobium sp. CF3.5]|uniref:hypothetical protein n=1 Tax=Aeromicrobium sp. CF3.5 TaxID=3373078 RepID=UPI003EE77422
MTWDAYNRRKESLREILAIADRDRHLPLTDLLDTADPHREAFEDVTAVLFDLQMLWFQRLSGTVDRLTADGTDDFEMVALDAWVSAAAELPSARALLDAHRHAPALAKAFAKEQAFLAGAAGVPVNHPDRVRHGERLIASARTEAARAPRTSESSTHARSADQRPGLIARLRSAIAA